MRNAAFLRWFCFSPQQLQKYLLGYYEGDTLRGSAVFCKRLWPGKTVFKQLDLWTVDSEGESFQRAASALACEAVKLAAREGCDMVYFLNFSAAYSAVLRGLGIWLTKKFEGEHFAYGALVPDSEDGAYLTGFEGDTAL